MKIKPNEDDIFLMLVRQGLIDNLMNVHASEIVPQILALRNKYLKIREQLNEQELVDYAEILKSSPEGQVRYQEIIRNKGKWDNVWLDEKEAK